MENFNVGGYKILFFLENLLRKYIVKYLPEESFPASMRVSAQEIAKDNGIMESLNYHEALEYLHVGQLFDVIRSKEFQKFRKNEVLKVNISPLIRRRNIIMHSRYISFNQFEEVKEVCERVIENINDEEFIGSWNKFITEDIDQFNIPLIFVEYPLGKDFEKLVGRDKELREIKELLKRPFPLSIIRHGGLGKTALVLQLIEDLLYSPQRPFERIFFMSFKNSVFENGVVRKLEKVINNHNDLINRLAAFMGLSTQNKTFSEVEQEVWQNIFSKKTLLVLDNLETEIVQSNLSEFTRIADLFLSNYTCPSRLIITSRLGLGDSEKKYPLLELDLERTKELVKINLPNKLENLNKAEHVDWEWVQQYTCGNPGLILSFCDTFRNSHKRLMDIRVEFKSKYTLDARQLYDAQDVFLEFCFTNTAESLPKESQIFMAALSYLFIEADFKEVSEELLTFLIDEIGFSKLGIHNVKAQIFVNIGYLRPITGSSKYYVNELFVNYINGNYSNKGDVYTVFDLKGSEWYAPLKQMRSSIIDFQYEEDLSVAQILSNLYKGKYEQSGDNSSLLKAFFCDPTLTNLLYYIEKSKSAEVINNFTILDKVRSLLIQNKDQIIQERIVLRFIFCMSEINHLIKQGARDVTGNIRQNNLFDYFIQLQSRMSILRNGNFSINLRRKIVDFLIAINQLDTSENYVQNFESQMSKSCFELYSKQIGIWAGRDRSKCERYINKCNVLINSKFIRDDARAAYYVYLARYLREETPLHAFKISSELDNLPKDNNTTFSFYLESLLLRAQCLLDAKKGTREDIRKFIEIFNREAKTSRYKQVQSRKRKGYEDSLRFIERSLKRQS
ncbi:ATP-binding protein [Paenibacillus anseongense]|uniref:ATP-binding protein n=1 Tax=Paenibacillus anseongense TaxID=2682845 RepID=UPI002DBE4E5B|nr:ATP-binding protein [Paenibacillus anseongense]MEC0269372.1 ATP-binding protein [Paenibacillus anseongense]